MIGFGLTKNFYIALALLAVSGMLDGISVYLRGTIYQLMTPDDMKGRVSAVNNIFIGSSNEIGAIRIWSRGKDSWLSPLSSSGRIAHAIGSTHYRRESPETAETRHAHTLPSARKGTLDSNLICQEFYAKALPNLNPIVRITKHKVIAWHRNTNFIRAPFIEWIRSRCELVRKKRKKLLPPFACKATFAIHPTSAFAYESWTS